MSEKNQDNQGKQPLTESVSNVKDSSPKTVQDITSNISNNRFHNSTSSCAPTSSAQASTTVPSQSGSISACAPNQEK